MTRVIFLIIAFSLGACSGRYDRIAETSVSGTLVRVGLKHSHPFLAEYKKFLEVERASGTTKKELFPDSGGYAWVALADDHGTIEVRDFGGVQYSIASGPKTETRLYLGRFDFDPKRVYRFIPASEDPQEPPNVAFKG